MLQMVAAADSKRLRSSMWLRTCCTKAVGTLKVLGWPLTSTEIWYWVCKFLPSAQRQLARPQARWRSTKEPEAFREAVPGCAGAGHASGDQNPEP